MICEKMGWTYQELMDTPEEFIQALCARLDVENKHQEAEMKKIKQNMPKPRRKR